MNRKAKINVNSVDALIIFRADGSYEISLPDIAGDDVPEHLVTTAAIGYALQDPEIMEILYENFHKQCESLKEPRTLSLFPGLKN